MAAQGVATLTSRIPVEIVERVLKKDTPHTGGYGYPVGGKPASWWINSEMNPQAMGNYR
ncbi:hypothetical protein G3M48_001870, partial [Beauveria asiatica]